MTTDEMAALRAEVADLRALIERLAEPAASGAGWPQSDAGVPGTAESPVFDSDPSELAPSEPDALEPTRGRRAFLRGAGLALGGAAAASALGADPAAAANGDTMKVGITTNAATASTGLAVTGTSAAYGIGVTDNGLAAFFASAAVAGHAKNAFGSGVLGEAEGGLIGVRGRAPSGVGVYGETTTGTGVAGQAGSGDAVYGQSTSGSGVHGVSYGAAGVVGEGPTRGVTGLGESIGVVGEASAATGVGVAGTGDRLGVSGLGDVGVYGETSSAVGGAGGSFVGLIGPGVLAEGTPSMRMVSRSVAPPSQAKAFVAGSVDHAPAGTLWACVADGTPGTWRKLAGPETAGQLHVLPATIRIYDSRPGEQPTGVTKGQLGANQERVIDAKQGGAVPAGATAVLLNVTVVTGSPAGWLAVFKNGITWPGNSTLNWDHQGQAIANSAVVAVDASAKFKVRAAQATDVIIDAIGYYR